MIPLRMLILFAIANLVNNGTPILCCASAFAAVQYKIGAP